MNNRFLNSMRYNSQKMRSLSELIASIDFSNCELIDVAETQIPQDLNISFFTKENYNE